MLKAGDVVRVHLFDRGDYGARQHQCGIVKQAQVSRGPSLGRQYVRVYWLETREEHWTTITGESRQLYRTRAGNIFEKLESEDVNTGTGQGV